MSVIDVKVEKYCIVSTKRLDIEEYVFIRLQRDGQISKQ